MDFELSPEQKMLRDTVRSFAKQKSPVERFRKLRDEQQSWDPSIWRHMGELGWLSLPFPEAIGGFGGDFVDVAVLVEGLGKTLVPEPYIASVVLAGMALLHAGSSEQHERWLAPMIDGGTSLALAHDERRSRYSIDDIETTATPDGDGFTLRGEKTFVLNGHLADHIVVSAKTSEGLGLFMVERTDPGVEVTTLRTMDGHGAALIRLDAVIPTERRLGADERDVSAVVARAHDFAAAAACAEMVGLCQTVLDATLRHLKEREQFGVAIGSFQVLQHYAVDMFVQMQLVQSMSTLASVKATDEDFVERARAISAAKAHVSRSSRFIAQQAIQLHGGIGITDEHDVGLFFKRIHALNTSFGDEDHHVRRFAALPTFADEISAG
jgi:alkylation response protein AidB-like acyl-CoA dehydrogenase